MNIYLWTKILHLWLVAGWMTTVLALPLLLACAAAAEAGADRSRLLERGRGLYRLGHHLFGWAFLCGLILWLHFGIGGAWLHAKLGLVGLLLVHFTLSGRWIKRAAQGRGFPPPGSLRWHGRWPFVALGFVIWLVLGKPF